MTKLETILALEEKHNVLICRTFDDEGKEVFDVYDNVRGFWLTIREYSRLKSILHNSLLEDLRNRYSDYVNGTADILFHGFMFKPSKLNLWNEKEKEGESWLTELVRKEHCKAS